MSTGAGAVALGPNTRVMTHFGRSPSEREKNTVGQWGERRARTHTRDNTVSLYNLPPLSVTTSTLYRREYGESTGNDIRENRRRSEWNTGGQGMGSAVETIEGQGSNNSALYFGPHTDCRGLHMTSTPDKEISFFLGTGTSVREDH